MIFCYNHNHIKCNLLPYNSIKLVNLFVSALLSFNRVPVMIICKNSKLICKCCIQFSQGPRWTPGGQFAPQPVGHSHSAPSAVSNPRQEVARGRMDTMRDSANKNAAAELKAMMVSAFIHVDSFWCTCIFLMMCISLFYPCLPDNCNIWLTEYVAWTMLSSLKKINIPICFKNMKKYYICYFFMKIWDLLINFHAKSCCVITL